MNITLRQFRTDDLLLYENWRNEINAHHHMSNFYPPQFWKKKNCMTRWSHLEL
jgi:hypothetical protein